MTVTNNGYEASAIAARRSTTTITFDGTAGAGGVGTVTVFSIVPDSPTQFLIKSIVAHCPNVAATDLVGAGATISLGVINMPELFIAATTATTIDQDEFWVSTSPIGNGGGGIALPAACKDIVINTNIIFTVAAAAITAGTLVVYCDYTPLVPGFSLGTYTLL